MRQTAPRKGGAGGKLKQTLTTGLLRTLTRGLLVRLAVVLVLLAPALACARRAEEDRARLLVAAASNLTDAFDELGWRFTERTGERVAFSYGATGGLAKQIENGAPFDVFAAADARHVEGLEAKGFLTGGSRAIYARGRLVLWVPAEGRAAPARVEDLAGERVTRVAVAQPDVAPYGQAAVEALKALGVWERVGPKVVYAQTVAQAKQFASTGNADAAFIPRSLYREGEGTAIEVAESLHSPIEQALAVVKASRKQEAARRFAEFVLGEEGQAILARYGYGKPQG
jgi:molybdate transport system substrate-binding protein